VSRLAPTFHLRLLRRSRWRVALLGALVVTGVLGALASGAYVTLKSATYARLYERLEIAAMRVSGIEGSQLYVVVDERGRPLVGIPQLEGSVASWEGFRIVTDPQVGAFAVLHVPIAGGGMQVIATPCQEEISVLREVLRVLTALTLTGGLVALPVGYALAGLALRPLDDAVRERSEFVALASHQLRTPLAVIKTSAELAQAGRGLSPDEALRTIAQQTQRIEALAARLTALGRAETDAKTQVALIDLSEVVQDVVTGLAAAAQQKGVTVGVEGEPAWIRVDRDAAADMITAIVENAIQFSPAGGTVSARVRAHGGHAIAEVEDRGPGIQPEELPLVTDPFYQGQRARGGYGLGLAIARAVAERHGGRLTIESVVGRGTTVRVSLPARPAPPGVAPA